MNIGDRVIVGLDVLGFETEGEPAGPDGLVWGPNVLRLGHDEEPERWITVGAHAVLRTDDRSYRLAVWMAENPDAAVNVKAALDYMVDEEHRWPENGLAVMLTLRSLLAALTAAEGAGEAGPAGHGGTR